MQVSLPMKKQMGLQLLTALLFLLLTGLGILGNMSVFVNYVHSSGGGIEKNCAQLILIHLVLTNTMLLLTKGLPKTIAAFRLNYFLSIMGCRITLYLERVSRGLSICTSSLLTVVQASTISPRASVWRRLKPRSAWHVLLLLLFFWILNCFISMSLLNIIIITDMNSSHFSSDHYCSTQPGNLKINNIFVTFMAVRDAVSPIIMAVASGYMVFLLHKHHQHVLYLRNSKLLYKTPPEMKAAQSILLLMLSFLFFYLTDCLLSLYLIVASEPISILARVQELATLGYPFLSPFVLIHRDEHLPECWQAQWTKRH
ncbi:vomeronasal type-1 receptor 4-like [Perognathus longimembris pacificus]|uniref:vomeronasal type-1 receptor 4-like n=1 Tax=Perognathus longimembris pacificus TaxID=214514 RepID=UPI002018D9E1|nr:vomeronasal type-1 receptor 4-like [Perognathus longimembris pacificus]